MKSVLESSVSLRNLFVTSGVQAGCPRDQLKNFRGAEVLLQPRQLAASSAARLCDLPGGPTSIGFGGARGGGKTFWMFAQIGADDCQRFPGLKCLLLRKVGKSIRQHFEDIRYKVFGKIEHRFSPSSGVLSFPNGSRIVIDHYQHERDLEKYIGREFDVIGIEEATTLTARKYSDISTSNRSSTVLRDGRRWRPRIYSTTNPGGVGHGWYKAKFVLPFREAREKDTRFIPALVTDNPFINPEYVDKLDGQFGWKKRAWRYGDWDINAGQFFTTFRHNAHVIRDFDENRAVEWYAAMDYGFTHYTVVLLGCVDGDGNMFVLDEHARRNWVPQHHAPAILAMFKRHDVYLTETQAARNSERGVHSPNGKQPANYMPLIYPPGHVPRRARFISRFVAGRDVFSTQGDGSTVALQYGQFGFALRPAATDRVSGWSEILHRLGDPERGIVPKLFIHARCARLIESLPNLQHDPNRGEDVLKVDPDDDGEGGDDAADALRYLVATKPRLVEQVKLKGF